MGSTRLPGKTLKFLGGKPSLWHVVERCRAAVQSGTVIIATTTNPEDDAIAQFCNDYDIPFFRGSSDNVLDRYYRAARQYGIDVVARVTADCPLVDPKTIDRVFSALKDRHCDYVSNVVPGERTFPRGFDVEVFTFAALEKAHREATEKMETEHVTPYLWQNKKKEFNVGDIVTAPPQLKRPQYRLTVDYPEDFEVVEKIYNALYRPGAIIDSVAMIAYLDAHPEIASINADCEARHAKHAPVNQIQREAKK